GLLFKYVEGGALDVAAANSGSQVGLVHDPPSRDVDDAYPRLGKFQRLGVQQVRRLFVLGQVDRDEVALAQQRVEFDQLDAHVSRALFGDKGVISDKTHAKGVGALGNQSADLSESHDAESFAVELDSLPLGAFPLPTG